MGQEFDTHNMPQMVEKNRIIDRVILDVL